MSRELLKAKAAQTEVQVRHMAPGETVVTRRGKRGTVVAVREGELDVRFGGKIFTMRPGQFVSESAYRRMQSGAAYNAAQTRNQMRGV